MNDEAGPEHMQPFLFLSKMHFLRVGVSFTGKLRPTDGALHSSASPTFSVAFQHLISLRWE